jgi:hypothetical protein
MYYLKASGGRTIIFGVSELKKSSGSDRQVTGRRPDDVIWIGRLFLMQKKPSEFKGTRTDIARAPPGHR